MYRYEDGRLRKIGSVDASRPNRSREPTWTIASKRPARRAGAFDLVHVVGRRDRDDPLLARHRSVECEQQTLKTCAAADARYEIDVLDDDDGRRQGG